MAESDIKTLRELVIEQFKGKVGGILNQAFKEAFIKEFNKRNKKD